MKQKIIPIAGGALILGLGVSAIFLFLEAAVRIKTRYVSPRQDAVMAAEFGEPAPIFAAHPYLIVYNHPNLSTRTTHTNSRGFRGTREYSDRKPAGTRRVFVIGGSAAVGFGASGDEATIAGQLEILLNERKDGWRYEVINAACNGFGSHQDLILTALELLPRDPDIIVQFAGGTDINTSLLPAWSRNYHELMNEAQARITHPWYEHSQAVGFLKNLIHPAVPADFQGVFHEELAEVYASHVRSLAGMASASDVRFLSVLQPALVVSRKKKTEEESGLLAQALARKNLPSNYESVAVRLYQSVQTRMANQTLPRGTAWFDGTKMFDRDESRAFGDALHLTDHGNRLAAETILAELSTRGLLTSAHPPRSLASPK